MKRWQVRGEVQDSDDDEALDLEEQPQAPLRKKARLQDTEQRSDTGATPDLSRPEQDDQYGEEVDWLQPRVANTYGRRSRPRKTLTAQSPDVSLPGAVQRSSCVGESPRSQVASQHRAADGLVKRQSPVPSAHSTVPDRTTYADSDANSPTSLSRPGQPSSSGQGPLANLFVPAAPSSDDEDLPSVRNVKFERSGRSGEEECEVERMSSGLSSPLSERSVSPAPPAATFRFPRPELPPSTPTSPDPSQGGAEIDLSSAREKSRAPIKYIRPHDAPSQTTQTGRRSFRARNAQQLHPYAYENAIFHKQWRAHGLRPVNVVRVERGAPAADRDSSSDAEQDSWQPSQRANSHPGSDVQAQDVEETRGQVSEEDLPDISLSARQTAFAVIQRGLKRQKVSHGNAQLTAPGVVSLDQVNNLSVPPSPPPTSSASNGNGKPASKAAVFRFPRGMTPKPRIQQRTPNVSSGPRRRNADSDDDGLFRSRMSTATKPRHAQIDIGSSTDSSSSESEPERDHDVNRLLKERKRIRGVLPASWLKIDLKAQQRRSSPSPVKRAEQATASPEKAQLQRGVAHRVVSRIQSDHAPIPISDSDSEDSGSFTNVPEKRQRMLQFDRDSASAGSAAFADEEHMEIDYVDAMLAGVSKPKSRGASTKKRQPRITEAMRYSRGQRQDFGEERNAARRAGAVSDISAHRHRPHKRRQHAQKPSAPLLSIVDAPPQAAPASAKVPQFVKLAIRRARAQEDQGRHSPHRKHIRLATERDTEDATEVFRAWREGTLLPRQQSPGNGHAVAAQNLPEIYTSPVGQAERRAPLSELSDNRQSRLPGALRKTSAKQQGGARRLNLGNGKMRQARLDPVPIEQDSTSQQGNTSPEGQAHTPLSMVERHRARKLQAAPLRYKGAQLETLESEFDRGHRNAAFERRMNVLTENVVRGRNAHTPAAPMQLQRFLYEPDRRPPAQQHQLSKGARAPQTGHRELVHRQRKRPPQRLDADARQYRQPSEPLLDVITIGDDHAPLQRPLEGGTTLAGLGPFGTRYALDFDTLPLPLGTYFHDSSFIGSGDFAASLDFAGRDVDVFTGRIRIHVNADVLDLGIWNEEVAVAVGKITPAISDAISTLTIATNEAGSKETLDVVLANVDYLLRSMVRYFTSCLAFSDPIDRRACVQSLHRITEDVLDIAAETCSADAGKDHLQGRCLQYAAVLAHQALVLSKHSTIPTELAAHSQQLFHKATSRLAQRLVHVDLQTLSSFYDDLRRVAKREAGVRDTDSAVCSVTILHHLLDGAPSSTSAFWSIVSQAMNVRIESLISVADFDQVWGRVFSMLPALEIDSRGILQLDSRFSSSREDWSLCKALLDRLFQLYPATSTMSGSTINEYVRATLIRCARLQSRWGWSRCEPILYSIFDFFSRRGLAPLHKEEAHGSPAFLQELECSPSFEAHPEDHSFHIFLKMLAHGLRTLRDRNIYPDKKIGGIAYRFLPNHGRTHRKDADVRQEDLDALRNHHDLLSTIYYVSPPDHRPRLDLIRNLVDHAESHREACRLSVRAWRNLASYQASTSEPVDRLAPFVNWFEELLRVNVLQYRHARVEVERDAASAMAEGKPPVPQDAIESIISANQRQIAATLTDALAAVKHALKTASSVRAVGTILAGTSFWQVFDLFDPAARKIFGTFVEGLEVFRAALEAQEKLKPDGISQPVTEDSQDYGDFSALQQLMGTQPPKSPIGPDVVDTVHDHLAHVVSSIIGADGMADDNLLTRTIDAWVELASAAVAYGKKTWQNYVSAYSSEAWSQLRDTEQRRKYTPYFLAKVAEYSDVDVVDAGILSFWLRALVDREATLKFQHVLTSALLNRQDSGPLLVNLPFIRSPSGKFAMTLSEFRRGRLGLISSVLSNMHRHLDGLATHSAGQHAEIRRLYSDMLRRMMQAMKTNYQDVQPSGGNALSADPHAHGDYVGFVQQIISFLQQYTADICQVDRFFLDSSAFPLPATDPTYVVGKLKGYSSKLATANKRTQLAVFVQAVSERAAVDGKQQYLVDQLALALTGEMERGDPRAPSLRHVLMTAIFPAYIEHALSNPSSWILALPIIEACGRAIADLLYCVRFEERDSVQAALATTAVSLRSMLRAVQTVLAYPGQLMLTHVLVVLRTIFEATQSSLTGMRHIARVAHDPYLNKASTHLDECAQAMVDLLSGNEDSDMPATILDDPPGCMEWSDTRAFTSEQLEKNLRGWHVQDGQYFMKRGANSVEVVMRLDDKAAEKSRLFEALRRYRESYRVVFGDGQGQGPVSTIDELVV